MLPSIDVLRLFALFGVTAFDLSTLEMVEMYTEEH